MLKITQIGEIFRGKNHSQYPSPVFIDDNTIRIFYSDRYNGQMIPCFIDVFASNPMQIKNSKYAFLPFGKSEKGDFDSTGIAPQGPFWNKEGQLSLLYTGYTPGVIDQRYETWIGLAVLENGEWVKYPDHGIFKSLFDPISTCTPCHYRDGRGQALVLYNTHLSWRWSTVTSQYEPEYTLAIYNQKNNKSSKFLDHVPCASQTRPWIFDMDNKRILLYSERSTLGAYRTNPDYSYKIKAMVQGLQEWHSLPITWEGKDEGIMKAYATCLPTKWGAWIFYNTDFGSGIKLGRLEYV